MQIVFRHFMTASKISAQLCTVKTDNTHAPHTIILTHVYTQMVAWVAQVYKMVKIKCNLKEGRIKQMLQSLAPLPEPLQVTQLRVPSVC